MDAPLSQREFDTWREGDETFKSEIRQFISRQTVINLDVEGRLTGVLHEHGHRERQTVIRAGFLSSIIGAIVGALTGFFAK